MIMDKKEALEYFQTQMVSKFDVRTIGQLWRIIIEDLYPGIYEFGKSSLDDIIKRLKSDEPIQYITGISWFMDLKISVNPSVLIPRPETEELVDYTINKLQDISPLRGEGVENKNTKILDIGTGSGCIPLAIKKNLPGSEVFGLDISADALQVARHNGQNLGLNVNWIQGDILAENVLSPELIFDAIISNPPYITIEERKIMDASVLKYEPDVALFTGNDDPLQFYKAIIPFAKKYLSQHGFIALECNENFSKEVAKLYKQEIGQSDIITDMQGKDRFVFSAFPI